MLSVNLMGGLGNQLFQIITTISTAMNHKIHFCFEHTGMLTTGTPRPTYWTSVFHKLQLFLYSTDVYSRIPFIIIPETSFNYTPIEITDASLKCCKLNGYYQSPKYFHDNFKNIKILLGINDQQQIVQTKYSNLLNDTTIALHFRLGDYKKQQHKLFHSIVGIEYYVKALNYIFTTLKKESYNVLYFCEAEDNEFIQNRIEEMKVNYDGITNVTFIKVPDDLKDYEQLLLMSVCEHNIMANSTFSWWGAYLNEHTDKIVCYPGTWFGPASKHKTNDLFLDSWVKII
jgi:hypothetical protein